MPMCTKDKIEFGRFGRRVIEANFSGGEPNSDGGLLLVRQVDRHLVLSRMAAVALANKNARILWAVMTQGEAFDPRHVSIKPGASAPPPAATPAQRATNPSRSRHQARRCSDRPDRQRAGWTNPWWLVSSMSTDGGRKGHPAFKMPLQSEAPAPLHWKAMGLCSGASRTADRAAR